MPTQVYKMTIGFGCASFGSIPADGFTDTWYTTADDPAVVQTRVRGYMDRRVAICNNQVTGVRFRVSVIPTNILAYQNRYRPGPGPFPTGDTPWNALWTTVAIASQGVRRQWLIAGMTDDFIRSGAWLPNNPGWDANFTELVRYMRNEGAFALQVINNANLLQTVTKVNTDGTVTLPAGHGIAKGNLVRFFRTKYTDKNLGNVKGNWLVTDVVGATAIVLNNWPPTGLVAKGRLRKLEYTYPIVSDIQIAGVRKRNIGRPLELLVGKRRRKSA